MSISIMVMFLGVIFVEVHCYACAAPVDNGCAGNVVENLCFCCVIFTYTKR